MKKKKIGQSETPEPTRVWYSWGVEVEGLNLGDDGGISEFVRQNANCASPTLPCIHKLGLSKTRGVGGGGFELGSSCVRRVEGE